MIQISVRTDIKAAIAKLNRLQREQVPYATMRALNATADDVKEAERKEIADVFDRPRANTLNSVYVKYATKANPVSRIALKDVAGKGVPASKYLEAQIKGGVRRLKRFEKALRAVGALPPGMYAVPGSGAKIDAEGNMSGGQIVQILSYFKAFPEAGYKANMTDARRAKLAKGTKKQGGFSYFVGRPGGGKLPLGVWQRFNPHGFIKPVLIFVDSVLYEPRFDFYYVGKRAVEKRFRANFDAALVQALATAR